MGTTALLLPYPEPTDPVAEGAAAIRALAEAVDPKARAVPVLFRVASGTDHAGIAGQTDIFMQVNATTVAGRRYRISAQLLTQVATNTLRRFYILRDGVTLHTALFTLVGGFQAIQFEYIDAPPAGAHVYKLQASSDSGTVTLAHSVAPGTLLAEDIG